MIERNGKSRSSTYKTLAPEIFCRSAFNLCCNSEIFSTFMGSCSCPFKTSSPITRIDNSSPLSLRGLSRFCGSLTVTEPLSNERSINSKSVYCGNPHMKTNSKSAAISFSVTPNSLASSETAIPWCESMKGTKSNNLAVLVNGLSIHHQALQSGNHGVFQIVGRNYNYIGSVPKNLFNCFLSIILRELHFIPFNP
ncbi:unannotated protein [freshwater metagenome]|uniref:Unannotated protein n=1 Tax=freshwater metagenome TaxID=449393 RepID=A0A6J7UGF2_9ZZZZ